MNNIYIIRHGESEGNIKKGKTQRGYIIGTEIELTENGKMQSKSAGDCLNHIISRDSMIAFWVSPFKRTRQTFAEIEKRITNKNFEYFEDPRLVEQDFGDFDFQFYEKWKEISPHSYYINQARYNTPSGRFFARLENGENMLDVYNRMSLFVTTRLERTNYTDNVIITHGNASRALVMFLLNQRIEEYYESDVPQNASIRHIVRYDTRYVDKGYIN